MPVPLCSNLGCAQFVKILNECNIGPDRLELIIFVIIDKKIDNHPSRLISAKSIMHYQFSSALYW